MTSPPVALQSREEGREAALGGRGICSFPSEVPENARKGRRVASDGRLRATAGRFSKLVDLGTRRDSPASTSDVGHRAQPQR